MCATLVSDPMSAQPEAKVPTYKVIQFAALGLDDRVKTTA